MWIAWLERNCCSFEDTEKMLEELKVLCQRILFEWSHCWGFTDCSSLSEFRSEEHTSELVFFLIGNQKFIINEKEKKKVQVVHDDEQQEKKNKQHSKTRTQETKLREDKNSEREEQSVKPQQ